MTEQRNPRPGAPFWGGAWGGAWFGIGAGVCAAMACLEPNLLEEGLMLHVGERLLDGDHLYRDIRLVTGPVPYALVAALFSLFGVDALVARGGVVVLQGLACASVYGLARRADTGPGAHLAAAVLAFAPVLFFPLLSTMFYTTVATSLVFPVAYLVLRGTESARFAFGAGVLLAVAALSKQTTGAALALAMVPVVAAGAAPERRGRLLIALCCGGALVTGLTLAVFAGLGDLGALVSSMIERPRGRVFGFSFINLWPPGQLAEALRFYPHYYLPTLVMLFGNGQPGADFSWGVLTAQVLFVVPMAALVATLLRRIPGPLPTAVWALAAAAAVQATNLYPRADWGHLVFAAPAALCLAVVLVCSGAGAASGWVSRIAAATLLPTLVIGTWVTGSSLDALASESRYGPRVPMRPVSPRLRADVVPRVLGYLEERLAPGEAIFVARTEPLIYFALAAPNPTPFTGALQVWGLRGAQEDEILAALENVRFVVMSDIDEPLFTYFSDELPRVQRYLERHFDVPTPFTGRSREDSWLLVLERGLDRGATVHDLLDPDLAPRAWMRSPAGTLEPSEGPWTNLPTLLNRRPLIFAVGPLGGGVDWLLDVPEAAHLELSLDYGPIGGYRTPPGAEFAVWVAEGGEYQRLASWRTERAADDDRHAWSTFVVDLSEFAARRVTLRLETTPDAPMQVPTFAIWGSPRIATSPEAGRRGLH